MKLSSIKTDSVLIIRMVVSAAVAAGADRDRLLAEVGLGPSDLDDSTLRVSADLHERVMNAGVQLSGDGALGIHVGEWLQPPALSIVGYIFFSATTLREALERTGRYQRLLSGLGYPDLRTDGEAARLVLVTREQRPGPWPRQLAEWALSAFYCLMRRFCGEALSLAEVHWQHSRPADVCEHERVFAAPLSFDHADNQLIFDRAMLDLPNIAGQADPDLMAMLERHASQQLQQLPHSDDWIAWVRASIARRFRGGSAEISDVAKALGCSVRSLQRRLRDRKTNFRLLCTEVRRELAERYLQEPDLSIDEVAFLLGFSDRSTFHRAFRTWHGCTPAAYRRQRGGEG